MGQFLLHGGDAAGIGAADDVGDGGGQLELFFLHDPAAVDDVDGDVGVDEPQGVQIEVDPVLDLHDVLAARLAAAGVFNDGYAAVQPVQTQDLIDLHAPAGLNVVDDQPTLYAVYVHLIPPPKGSE